MKCQFFRKIKITKIDIRDIFISDITEQYLEMMKEIDDVDVETVATIMEEMSKTFPNITIIPVNEWILKGMTVVRQAKSVGDMVDMSIIDQPLEVLYPDLFNGPTGTAVPKGGIIW